MDPVVLDHKSIYLLMVLISTSDTLYAKPLSTFLVQMLWDFCQRKEDAMEDSKKIPTATAKQMFTIKNFAEAVFGDFLLAHDFPNLTAAAVLRAKRQVKCQPDGHWSMSIDDDTTALLTLNASVDDQLIVVVPTMPTPPPVEDLPAEPAAKRMCIPALTEPCDADLGPFLDAIGEDALFLGDARRSASDLFQPYVPVLEPPTNMMSISVDGLSTKYGMLDKMTLYGAGFMILIDLPESTRTCATAPTEYDLMLEYPKNSPTPQRLYIHSAGTSRPNGYKFVSFPPYRLTLQLSPKVFANVGVEGKKYTYTYFNGEKYLVFDIYHVPN